jgi:perosamine synthetase
MKMIPHSRPWITDSDRKALDAALGDDMIAQGERVSELEQRMASAAGASGAVAVASGTAALTIALHALGQPPGAEVVVPTYVCVNVLQAVTAAGYRAVLCDVGEEWTMTPETVQATLTPATRAVVAVHTMGVPCDVGGLMQFGLPVIEDACQAWGASIDGRPVGALGDIGVVSTHATKCMTTGEGGLAFSTDTGLVGRLRAIRDEGSETAARVAAPMSDIQAALGLSQLARYDAFLDRRRELADRYFDELGALGIRLPHNVRERSMFFRFPVRVDGDFERHQAAFAGAGVQVRCGVDTLLHRLLRQDPLRFPGAESLYRETLSLPLYPALTREDEDRVVSACDSVWGARRGDG